MFGKPKEVKSNIKWNKGSKLTIHVQLKFESDDIHLNEEAPNRFQVKSPPSVVVSPAKANISEPEFTVVCTGGGADGEIRISSNLYYCDVAGACSMGNVDFVVVVTSSSGSDDANVRLEHTIEKFT